MQTDKFKVPSEVKELVHYMNKIAWDLVAMPTPKRKILTTEIWKVGIRLKEFDQMIQRMKED